MKDNNNRLLPAPADGGTDPEQTGLIESQRLSVKRLVGACPGLGQASGHQLGGVITQIAVHGSSPSLRYQCDNVEEYWMESPASKWCRTPSR